VKPAIVAAGLATALAASPAVAQTMLREAGSAYFNFGGQVQNGDRFFEVTGDSAEIAPLDLTILTLYGEVGIVDRWLMVTFSSQLFRRNSVTNDAVQAQGIVRGVGDSRIGLWTNPVQLRTAWGRFRVLGAVQFGIPTGDPTPEGPGDDPTQDAFAELLPTGDGEFDVEYNVGVSQQIEIAGYPLRHFAEARFGYWQRTSTRALPARFDDVPEDELPSRSFSDAVTYWFQVGTQIKAPYLDRVWVLMGVNGVASFAELTIDDGDPNPDISSAASFGIGNGVSYTNLSGEVQVALPLGFGLGARIDDPLGGNLVLDAVSYRFFASYEF
jgi:hypothetical protein